MFCVLHAPGPPEPCGEAVRALAHKRNTETSKVQFPVCPGKVVKHGGMMEQVGQGLHAVCWYKKKRSETYRNSATGNTNWHPKNNDVV